MSDDHPSGLSVEQRQALGIHTEPPSPPGTEDIAKASNLDPDELAQWRGVSTADDAEEAHKRITTVREIRAEAEREKLRKRLGLDA